MIANPLTVPYFNLTFHSQANHASINTRGPLKDDWSKGCPLDWSKEERDEKCVSLQEAIWGTKVLQRLEEIKLKVDPHFMFNCNGCVGITEVTGNRLYHHGIARSKTLAKR